MPFTDGDIVDKPRLSRANAVRSELDMTDSWSTSKGPLTRYSNQDWGDKVLGISSRASSSATQTTARANLTAKGNHHTTGATARMSFIPTYSCRIVYDSWQLVATGAAVNSTASERGRMRFGQGELEIKLLLQC